MKNGGNLNQFWVYCDRGSPIADEVDAKVMFDAAHQFGIILGKAWPSPLTKGAHFMSMNTYKTLGGPAWGLTVSNDQEIAKKLDTILFPAMNANLDAAKAAAFATAMLD